MTLLGSKGGSQPETFGVFKQKLGKQHSWGFKQHFVSTNINQEQKSVERKEKKKCATPEATPESEGSVDSKRGFVPSDVNDPTKRAFLSQLSKRIFTEQRKENLFSKLRVLYTGSPKNNAICSPFYDSLYGSNAYSVLSDWGGHILTRLSVATVAAVCVRYPVP
jgi:hypothetical protein